MSDIGTQLLDVPFGDMVKSLASAIAEAQFDLDHNGVRLTQMMAGEEFPTGDTDENGEDIMAEPVKVKFGEGELSMLELGFTPTFYQFVDTIIEVKVSINISTETSVGSKSTTVKAAGRLSLNPFGGGVKATASSVSASYASKYSYSAEGSSLIRTKLVPVPPPAILEERIRALIAVKEE